MKYGILGDIHANLSALDTVLQHLDREGCEVLVSVGDVVGYGASPRECIERLRERRVVVVKGNHDAAVAEELDPRLFNPYARIAVEWTAETLDGDEKAWLSALPYTATLEHCQVAHGTFHRPEQFDYILSVSDADPSLDAMERSLCFVGHSHIPLTVLRFQDDPDRTAYSFDRALDLDGVARALMNVGSVGQPRDENPEAACAIYDATLQRVELHRVAYPIHTEVERILQAGLPEVLAERLRFGV